MSGVPYTIFRATWFMETLPLFVRGRAATIIGRQPHRLHWLAADDYARMVARSYRTPEAPGRALYLYGEAGVGRTTGARPLLLWACLHDTAPCCVTP